MSDQSLENEVDVNAGVEGNADGDDNGEDISRALIDRIMKLKEHQEELDNLDEEYRTERLAIEQKYLQKRTPMYEKRSQFVQGLCNMDGEPNGASESDDGPAEQDTIPMFWLKAMMNNETLSEFIFEDDFEALGCLEDVKLDILPNFDGYSLSFHFKENDYFENEVLTKTYKGYDLILNEEKDEQEVESTQIEWKAKKDLTKRERQVKQKKKKDGKVEKRYVTRVEKAPSFFWFFSDPVEPKDEEEEEEEEETIELDYDQDFEVGETFRLAIIPNAINWFTGEAADSDDEDDEGDEDDYDPAEDGDDEVEGENDFDEEEDDEGRPAEAVGGADAPAGGEQPECKQS